MSNQGGSYEHISYGIQLPEQEPISDTEIRLTAPLVPLHILLAQALESSARTEEILTQSQAQRESFRASLSRANMTIDTVFRDRYNRQMKGAYNRGLMAGVFISNFLVGCTQSTSPDEPIGLMTRVTVGAGIGLATGTLNVARRYHKTEGVRQEWRNFRQEIGASTNLRKPVASQYAKSQRISS